MFSPRRLITKLALPLLGATATLFGVLGCGGETGGAPSGISGALTRATVRVSSFSLTTGSAINDLKEVDRNTLKVVDATPDTGGITSVAGALYPTRNSKSFRVSLKGAGSDREDVVLYYNIFDRNNSIYDTSNPTGRVSSDGLATSLTKLYVAPRPKSETPTTSAVEDEEKSAWAVTVEKQTDGTNKITYADSGEPVPTDRKIFEVTDAFSYAQVDNKQAVRVGRRNIIVQFFDDSAANVQTHYKQVAAISDPDAAASNETKFLSEKLTNTYVFATEIQPNQSASLTGGFAANNGDNGLVDSGTLKIRATKLPQRWGSLKFEAYEESFGLGRPSIIFSKIVNLSEALGSKDSFEKLVQKGTQAPATYPEPSANPLEFPYANRQRILKVYVTCYELPDATGAVLAQTLEVGDRYNEKGYPVVFIPTAQAKAVDTFQVGTEAVTSASDLLLDMELAPSISNVVASLDKIGEGDTRTITVKASSTVYPRFAVTGGKASGHLSDPAATTRTLSPLGFKFEIDPADNAGTVETSNSVNYKRRTGVIDRTTLTTSQQLKWKANATPFSQKGYADLAAPAEPAEFLQYLSYFPNNSASPSYSRVYAVLIPNRGTVNGDVQ